MNTPLRICLIAILFLILPSTAQTNLKWEKPFSVPNVLSQDQISISLLDYVSGHDVDRFEIEKTSEEEITTTNLIQSVEIYPKTSLLELEDCTKKAQLTQTSWIFLCKQNTLIRADIAPELEKTIYKSSGDITKLKPEQNLEECSDLAISTRAQIIAVACISQKAERKVVNILSFDPKDLTLQQNLVIDEPTATFDKRINLSSYDAEVGTSFHLFQIQNQILKEFVFWRIPISIGAPQAEKLKEAELQPGGDFVPTGEDMKPFENMRVIAIQSDSTYFYAVLLGDNKTALAACTYLQSSLRCLKTQIIDDYESNFFPKIDPATDRILLANPKYVLVGELQNGIFVKIYGRNIRLKLKYLDDLFLLGSRAYLSTFDAEQSEVAVFRLGKESQELFEVEGRVTNVFGIKSDSESETDQFYSIAGRQLKRETIRDPRLDISFKNVSKEQIASFEVKIIKGEQKIPQKLEVKVLESISDQKGTCGVPDQLEVYSEKNSQISIYAGSFKYNSLNYLVKYKDKEFRPDWVRKFDIDSDNVERLDTLEGFRSISKGKFVAWSKNKVQILECGKESCKQTGIYDYNPAKADKGLNFDLLNITSSEEKIILLLQIESKEGEAPRAVLTILDQEIKPEKEIVLQGEFQTAGIRLSDDRVQAILSTKLQTGQNQNSLYNLDFTLEEVKTKEPKLAEITNLELQICPSLVSFGLGAQIEVFVLSSCQNKKNVLYRLNSNTDSLSILRIAERFALPSIDQPEICITPSHAHIFNKKLGSAFFINFGAEDQSVYDYQLSELGISSISSVSCGKSQNFAKIIGSTSSQLLTATGAIEVTLIGDISHSTRRIHSVQAFDSDQGWEIASEFDQKLNLARSYAYRAKDTKFVQILNTLEDLRINLDLSDLKLDSHENISVNYGIWAGNQQKLDNHFEITLKPVLPILSPKIELKEDKKPELQNLEKEGSNLVLEESFNVVGPVKSLKIQTDDESSYEVKLRERKTEKYWSKITKRKYKGFTTFRDFWLGWTQDQLFLTKVNKDKSSEIFEANFSCSEAKITRCERQDGQRTIYEGEMVFALGKVQKLTRKFLEVVWVPKDSTELLNVSIEVDETWKNLDSYQVLIKEEERLKENENIFYFAIFASGGYSNSYYYTKLLKLTVIDNNRIIYDWIGKQTVQKLGRGVASASALPLRGNLYTVLAPRGAQELHLAKLGYSNLGIEILVSEVKKGENKLFGIKSEITCTGEIVKIEEQESKNLNCLFFGSGAKSHEFDLPLKEDGEKVAGEISYKRDFRNLPGSEVLSIKKSENFVGVVSVPAAGYESTREPVLAVYTLKKDSKIDPEHVYSLITSDMVEKTDFEKIDNFSFEIRDFVTKEGNESEIESVLTLLSSEGLQSFTFAYTELIIKDYKKLSVSADKIILGGIEDQKSELNLGDLFTSDFDPKEKEKDKKKDGFKLWIWIVAALIVICFMVGIAYSVYLKNESNKLRKDEVVVVDGDEYTSVSKGGSIAGPEVELEGDTDSL